MKRKLLFALPVLLLVAQSALTGVMLPVYLDWRSSNSYRFFDLAEDETGSWIESYKVGLGFSYDPGGPVRAELELTNQEEGLFSQVLLDHAAIGLTCDALGLELAIKDYGYGRDFLLYNRRNDDPLRGRNALLNYRWHGLRADYAYGKSNWHAGVANNSRNVFISEAGYELESGVWDVDAYVVYALKDDRYTNQVWHGGTQFNCWGGGTGLKGGFVYDYLPESVNFETLRSWHSTLEFSQRLMPGLNVILSTELDKPTDSNTADQTHEACLEASRNRWHGYTGLRWQSLPGEESRGWFLDVDYSPVPDLTLGVLFDYYDLSESRDFYKIGFQTGYELH